MKNKNLEAALWGAFYGDAYALGGHWVYDCEEIENADLNMQGFNNPMTSYHNDKKAGEFTHYGDQMLWLLESIALEKEFRLADFASRWKTYTQNYQGYVDEASKHTLESLDAGKGVLGCGSSSHDLSVVGRFMPLIYRYQNEFDMMMENVKLHTVFTHMNKELVQTAAYFNEVIMGLSIGGELESLLLENAKHYDEKLQHWVTLGSKSLHLETNEAIKELGQSCSVDGGFPSVIHLLLRYSGDFNGAMKANVLAGGDSAARGLLVGALLGAQGGMDVIDHALCQKLLHFEKIKNYISMIDAQNA